MRPWLGQEEAEAAAAAVTSGWVAQGPRVRQFEERFAAFVGAEHAVAISSCTTGLHLALLVMGVQPGDEVIVPSLSFIATANVVTYAGATPVFCDVDPHTQNVTPETVERVRTSRTRAVIVVDQAGIPADMRAMLMYADQAGLLLIQDAACAAGSAAHGRPVGAMAPIAVFSFHPRKLLTTGEGGMVVTRSATHAARLRRLREHGMTISASQRHEAAQRHETARPAIEQYAEVGFNYRMTDVQAAIGLVQLGKLPAMVQRRRLLAERYRDLLADVPGLVMAADPPYGTTNYQSFWVRLAAGSPVTQLEILSALAERGVSARRGIMASHLEPAYADHPRAPLPVTEECTSRSVILPLFHDLTESEQLTVANAFRAAVGYPPVDVVAGHGRAIDAVAGHGRATGVLAGQGDLQT